MLRSWATLLLPLNIPGSQIVHSYTFGHNETYMSLALDYGSLINHHESANARAGRPDFRVRRAFRRANYNVLKTCNMYACAHTQRINVHINTLKATKDIAAGQEIFIRYGSAEWFKSRNVSYTDVDYASTMWRPDLHPLPCRQSFRHSIGADSQHSFSVLEAIRKGTILEISLCVEVSVIVVDQFPYLWKVVLTGETENNEYPGVPTEFCLLTRTHRLLFCR